MGICQAARPLGAVQQTPLCGGHTFDTIKKLMQDAEPRQRFGISRRHSTLEVPGVMSTSYRKIPSLTERDAARFWRKVNKNGPTPQHRCALGPCWLWTGDHTRRSYGLFRLSGNTRWYAHRISYAITHEPFSSDLCICHHCDNPPCVNPSHLFLGTQGDNARDRDTKGRTVHAAQRWASEHPDLLLRGEDVGEAKLRSVQIPEIRAAHASGEAIARIARRYGVARITIRNVIRRISWAHIP
jgi:hypothetical protein